MNSHWYLRCVQVPVRAALGFFKNVAGDILNNLVPSMVAGLYEAHI